MSFIDQAAKALNATPEFKFQIVMFGRDALYIEGGKPIKIDAEEMIFKAATAMITVTGKELSITDLSVDCAYVMGAICNIAVNDL